MALRHKNIVQTFEHGLTTAGEQYLVMELIDGDRAELPDRDQERPHWTANAGQLLTQIAEAIWSTCTSRAICTATSARATSW